MSFKVTPGFFARRRNFSRPMAVVFQYLHFAEYDHIPLVPDLNERQITRWRKRTLMFLAITFIGLIKLIARIFFITRAMSGSRVSGRKSARDRIQA